MEPKRVLPGTKNGSSNGSTMGSAKKAFKVLYSTFFSKSIEPKVLSVVTSGKPSLVTLKMLRKTYAEPPFTVNNNHDNKQLMSEDEYIYNFGSFQHCNELY